MSKRHRKLPPKPGRFGDAAGYIPTKRVDAQTVLLDLAEKAKLAKHSGRKSSRNKSGLTVNHAAFGNQYGRLAQSLMPKLVPMVKVGDKLMFAPVDAEQNALYQQANALLATVERDAPIPDGIAPRGKARATKHTVPKRKHRRHWSRTSSL
jgi:hypothetical protein